MHEANVLQAAAAALAAVAAAAVGKKMGDTRRTRSCFDGYYSLQNSAVQCTRTATTLSTLLLARGVL